MSCSCTYTVATNYKVGACTKKYVNCKNNFYHLKKAMKTYLWNKRSNNDPIVEKKSEWCLNIQQLKDYYEYEAFAETVHL